MRQLGFLSPTNQPKKEKVAETLIVPTKFTHSICLGETGSGKTTGFIYPNLNERIKWNHGILFFDYKGKEHAAVKAIASDNKRLKDIVEVGVPWGAKINLIKYMNEAEIRNMTISLLGLDDKDPYWSTTGANIVVSLWRVIKSFINILDESKLLDCSSRFKEELKSNKLPDVLTFNSIAEITKTQKNIIHFVKAVHKISYSFQVLSKNIMKDALADNSEDEVIIKYESLVMKVLELSQNAKKDMQPLSVFVEADKEGSKSTTFQTIILSLSTTLATISTLEEFNSDEVDLYEQLNKGKIVVVNTSSISSEALGYFTGSLLHELSKRVTQKKIKAVSVFIDEAQRVLNPEVDLHIDTLREAKVEIFLSAQNINLLIEAIGENKFSALYQNLTQRYHFKNATTYDGLKLSKLNQYEYYTNNNRKVLKAEPLYLKNKKLFKAQLKYLRKNGIYEKFNLQEHENENILVFNSSLYKENKILLEAKDGSTRIVELKDKVLADEAFDFISDTLMDYTDSNYESKIKQSEQDKILKLFQKKMDKIQEQEPETEDIWE